MTQKGVFPAPTILYDFDVTWPAFGNFGVGTAFVVGGNVKFGAGSGGVYTLWAAASGAGTNNMALMAGTPAGKGGLVGQFQSTGAVGVSRPLSGFSMFVALDAGGLTTAFPTFCRLWRWQFIFRLTTAANSGLNCNMSIQPASGTAPGIISQNNTGFGISGSGNNTWQFFSRKTAGAGLAETVDLGITQNAWHMVDFVIRQATPLAAATLQIFLDGAYNAAALTRLFSAATMPNYTDPVNAAQFVPQVEQNDNANPGTLQIGYMRCMAGDYDQNGSLV